MPRALCPCGQPIPPERQQYNAVYCSKRCSWREKERRTEGTLERFASARCVDCGTSVAEPPRPGPPATRCAPCRRRSKYTPKPKTLRTCPVCGTSFLHTVAVYCSAKCGDRQRDRRKAKGRQATGSRSQRRTERLRQATLAKHGPTCWLCNRPIDLTLKWPDRMSYTVDHVHALHAGGTEYDVNNCRPAHLTCNTRRGASEGNRARKTRR